MILFFSGCGDSRWAAETLAKELNDRILFIPDIIQEGTPIALGEDEALGFVFPVYSWAPPKIVLEMIGRMHLVGNENPFVYMVCTCGDDTGHTDKILRKALAKKRLKLSSAYSLIMPETYINLPGFQLDTPDNEKRKLSESASRLTEDIIPRIRNREVKDDLAVGSMAGFKSTVLRWLFNAFLITDKPFKVHESCIGCGVCEQSCPVKNIRMDGGRPQWSHQCVGCMACYHHCPQNAIHFGKQTIGKGQYYFGHK